MSSKSSQPSCDTNSSVNNTPDSVSDDKVRHNHNNKIAGSTNQFKTTYTVVFHSDKLGLCISVEEGIASVSEVNDSEHRNRISIGDRMLKVDGLAVGGLSMDRLIEMIKNAPRPMEIIFETVENGKNNEDHTTSLMDESSKEEAKSNTSKCSSSTASTTAKNSNTNNDTKEQGNSSTASANTNNDTSLADVEASTDVGKAKCTIDITVPVRECGPPGHKCRRGVVIIAGSEYSWVKQDNGISFRTENVYLETIGVATGKLGKISKPCRHGGGTDHERPNSRFCKQNPNVRQRTAKEETMDDTSKIYHVVFSTEKLGLSVTCDQGIVTVSSVKNLLYKSQISLGDRLLTINGMVAKPNSGKDFREQIEGAKRPLKLGFQRTSSAVHCATKGSSGGLNVVSKSPDIQTSGNLPDHIQEFVKNTTKSATWEPCQYQYNPRFVNLCFRWLNLKNSKNDKTIETQKMSCDKTNRVFSDVEYREVGNTLVVEIFDMMSVLVHENDSFYLHGLHVYDLLKEYPKSNNSLYGPQTLKKLYELYKYIVFSEDGHDPDTSMVEVASGAMISETEFKEMVDGYCSYAYCMIIATDLLFQGYISTTHSQIYKDEVLDIAQDIFSTAIATTSVSNNDWSSYLTMLIESLYAILFHYGGSGRILLSSPEAGKGLAAVVPEPERKKKKEDMVRDFKNILDLCQQNYPINRQQEEEYIQWLQQAISACERQKNSEQKHELLLRQFVIDLRNIDGKNRWCSLNHGSTKAHQRLQALESLRLGYRASTTMPTTTTATSATGSDPRDDLLIFDDDSVDANSSKRKAAPANSSKNGKNMADNDDEGQRQRHQRQKTIDAADDTRQECDGKSMSKSAPAAVAHVVARTDTEQESDIRNVRALAPPAIDVHGWAHFVRRHWSFARLRLASADTSPPQALVDATANCTKDESQKSSKYPRSDNSADGHDAQEQVSATAGVTQLRPFVRDDKGESSSSEKLKSAPSPHQMEASAGAATSVATVEPNLNNTNGTNADQEPRLSSEGPRDAAAATECHGPDGHFTMVSESDRQDDEPASSSAVVATISCKRQMTAATTTATPSSKPSLNDEGNQQRKTKRQKIDAPADVEEERKRSAEGDAAPTECSRPCSHIITTTNTPGDAATRTRPQEDNDTAATEPDAVRDDFEASTVGASRAPESSKSRDSSCGSGPAATPTRSGGYSSRATSGASATIALTRCGTERTAATVTPTPKPRGVGDSSSASTSRNNEECSMRDTTNVQNDHLCASESDTSENFIVGETDIAAASTTACNNQSTTTMTAADIRKKHRTFAERLYHVELVAFGCKGDAGNDDYETRGFMERLEKLENLFYGRDKQALKREHERLNISGSIISRLSFLEYEFGLVLSLSS